jgi:hypothetical protein
MTPGLPFVPAIAVIVNIYLIFKLSILTLIRFTVWMAIGIHFAHFHALLPISPSAVLDRCIHKSADLSAIDIDNILETQIFSQSGKHMEKYGSIMTSSS